MSIHDPIGKLQLLLIELEYCVADVVDNENNLRTAPNEYISTLKQFTHMFCASTQNLILSIKADQFDLNNTSDQHDKILVYKKE